MSGCMVEFEIVSYWLDISFEEIQWQANPAFGYLSAKQLDRRCDEEEEAAQEYVECMRETYDTVYSPYRVE